MRKAMLFLAVLGLVGPLWAQNPALGKWKLNIAKSKFPPSSEAPIKEEILEIRDLGDGRGELTLTGTRTDGTPISSKVTYPAQGGALEGEMGKGISAVVTVISPGSVCTTYMQNGKQVYMIHGVVGEDGKTMRQIYRGVNAKGEVYEALAVWDKQ